MAKSQTWQAHTHAKNTDNIATVSIECFSFLPSGNVRCWVKGSGFWQQAISLLIEGRSDSIVVIIIPPVSSQVQPKHVWHGSGLGWKLYLQQCSRDQRARPRATLWASLCLSWGENTHRYLSVLLWFWNPLQGPLNSTPMQMRVRNVRLLVFGWGALLVDFWREKRQMGLVVGTLWQSTV